MSDLSEKYLFRYTNLASALDILANNRLTLLPPSSWSDRNDSGYMDAYRDALGLTTLGAMCFTNTFETSQHWNLFASGMDGVRLEFHKDRLKEDVERVADAVIRDVEYLKIDETADLETRVGDWPFVKRWPYKGESEVRIIYSSMTETLEFPEIPVRPDSLKRVTLSPDLPKELKPSVRDAILNAAKRDVSVSLSTMNENARWLKPVTSAAKKIRENRVQAMIADKRGDAREKDSES